MKLMYIVLIILKISYQYPDKDMLVQSFSSYMIFFASTRVLGAFYRFDLSHGTIIVSILWNLDYRRYLILLRALNKGKAFCFRLPSLYSHQLA